jgi:glycosyltransferase involved in cell wall biosynthesis
MVAAGHEVELLAFESKRHLQDSNSLQRLVKTHSAPLPDYSYSWGIVFLSFLLSLPAQVLRFAPKKTMVALVRKIQITPDVIILEGIHSAEWAYLLSPVFPKCPIVIRTSNVEWEILSRRSINERGLQKFFWRYQSYLMKRYERRLLSKVSGFTAISETDRRKLLLLAPDCNSAVMPTSFDRDAIQTRKPERATLLFVADFTWHANLLGLNWLEEKVIPLLKDVDALLQVVGKGIDPTEQKFGRLKICKMGFVDNLVPLQTKATIQIIVVQGGGGVKLRTVEALGWGIPLVINSFAAEGLDLESGTHCFIADSPSEFAAKIKDLLQDQSMQYRLSKNAMALAQEKYSWKTGLDNLMDLLRGINSSDAKTIK